MRHTHLLLLAAIALFCCSTQCGDECDPTFVPAHQTRWALETLDNSGATPTVLSSTSLPRQAFGIRISCPMDFLPADTVGADMGCGLFFFPDTPVVSLRVVTLLDFDVQHPALSDVTDLFRCRLNGGQMSLAAPRPVVSGSTYVGNQHTQYGLPEQAVYLLNQRALSVEADLLLTSPPTAPLTARFEIELTRRDSSVVSLKTPTIQLF
jgi:hypothetical protein